MKNKKKVILMLCALLAVAMVLVGCGSSDNKFVGTWTLDSAEASGLKLTKEQIQSYMPSLDMTVVINADGKGKAEGMGTEEEFEYKVSGNDITITVSGADQVFTLGDDGKLSAEVSGTTLYFVKK